MHRFYDNNIASILNLYNNYVDFSHRIYYIGINLKGGSMKYLRDGNRKKCEHGVPKIIRKMRSNIISRCYYERDKRYKCYGGRGIEVCQEWIQSSLALYNFALSHGWREGLTIDRINNDGDYEPSNVRFVPREQNRKKCKSVTVNDITKPIVEWAREKNISPQIIHNRIKRGIVGELLFCKYKLQKNAIILNNRETLTEASIKYCIPRRRLEQRLAKKYPENLLFSKEDLRKYNKGRYGYQEK